jgi:hypothetical protein
MYSVVKCRLGLYRSLAVLSGAMTAAILFAAGGAQAASSPFTFAQFEQATHSANANQFEYVDNGPGAGNDAELTTAVNGEVGVSIPVIFTFLTLNGTLPADLQGEQDATLTLTSSTVEPVSVVTAFGRQISDQEVFGNGNATDTLSIIRDTPAAEGTGSQTDLLTMTFTASLLGSLGDRTPSLSGDTGSGDVVTYASDFISISSTAEDDFNIAFTSWTSILDGDGLERSATAGDNYFASATAAGAGTFDSTLTPVVTSSTPEPAVATIGMAAGIMMLLLRRRHAARA